MTATAPHARHVCDAATHLADVFDAYLAGDVATRFNCVEVEALAELLTALGHTDTAHAWRKAHAEDDDAGDQHWNLHPDFDPNDHPFFGDPGDPCEWCGQDESANPHQQETR